MRVIKYVFQPHGDDRCQLAALIEGYSIGSCNFSGTQNMYVLYTADRKNRVIRKRQYISNSNA